MLVEVSLGRIIHNYKVIASLSPPEVAAVLKGNAYGHGLRAVAAALLKVGMRKFVVGSLDEVNLLLNLGAPWILWLYPSVSELRRVRDIGFWRIVRVALSDPSFINFLPSEARFHAYVDVGFGVFGGREILEWVLEDERLEGVWSHVGWLDDIPDFAELRMNAYQNFLEFYQVVRHKKPELLCHICGTSMTYYFSGCKETSFVRVGVGLFGYAEASALANRLRPAMRWYGEIVSVYKTPGRESLFYGVASVKPGWIVVVRAGYADGYIPWKWAFSPEGTRLELVSHVTMNLTAFWSEQFPGVRVGDKILLMDNAAEIAEAHGIPLEQVLCSGSRGQLTYVDF